MPVDVEFDLAPILTAVVIGDEETGEPRVFDHERVCDDVSGGG